LPFFTTFSFFFFPAFVAETFFFSALCLATRAFVAHWVEQKNFVSL
jgi:hypothetical protein